MPFVIHPFCNAYLANGERRVDVILKVHATLGHSNGAGGPLEYGILLDSSGSMSEQGRMAAAPGWRMISRSPVEPSGKRTVSTSTRTTRPS